MKIAEYLRENKLTVGELAAKVGCSQTMLYEIINRTKHPSIRLLANIAIATDWMVDPNSVVEDLFGKNGPVTGRIKRGKNE